MARDEAAITLRRAGAKDASFLEAMLVEAINWDPQRRPLTSEQVFAQPEHRHYVDGWPRHDDLGLVAENRAGKAIGAAWLRFFGADDPGYGFVAPGIPEVTIAVVDSARGLGIGTALLAALEEAARDRGIRALSLSVEPANPAARLYQRRGYVQVGVSGGAHTLRLEL